MCLYCVLELVILFVKIIVFFFLGVDLSVVLGV